MSYKIMIVDDEPANLRALERLFRQQYEVLTANSGLEALELLGHHDVALLITDQRMPGMNGIELLKKTVLLRPRMVRIILTGYTDVEALVEAINCGEVYRYVTKPWSNSDLRVTVQRALEHYEVSKKRHELQLTNERLVSLLDEIRDLATLEVTNEPEHELVI
jgi:YesN/AraC family two-component response regulator